MRKLRKLAKVRKNRNVYIWREVLENFGTVFAFKKPKTGQSFILFRNRKLKGSYWFDIDRHRRVCRPNIDPGYYNLIKTSWAFKYIWGDFISPPENLTERVTLYKNKQRARSMFKKDK